LVSLEIEAKSCVTPERRGQNPYLTLSHLLSISPPNTSL
jgi:hypothetical protein